MNSYLSNKRGRYEWVDYSKGICIFAVACLYSTWLTQQILGDSGWMEYWVAFAAPFRMPDFFLLSGLFLSRVIERPWKGYIDKKIVHYIYFFVLWTVINISIAFLVIELRTGDASAVFFTGDNRSGNGSFAEYVKQLWWGVSGYPFKMLWFIQMLPVYFLFTKLVYKVPKWIIFSIAVLFHAFPFLETGKVIIDEFWNRYIFFYVGYAGAPVFFKIAEWFKDHVVLALTAIIGWIVINAFLVNYDYAGKPFIGASLGILGAIGIIIIAVLISKLKFTKWISYLGKNSIVVYLAFYWPMKFGAYFLLPYIGLFGNHGFFALVITALGIFGSIVLSWVVDKSKWSNWLFKRPQWMYVGSYGEPIGKNDAKVLK